MMEFIKTDFAKGEAAKAAGGQYEPDYDGCIQISTKSSLRMMVAPGVLVLGSPLLAGFLFGPGAVAGLLAGSIVSGVQVAISASNTGGAWDNCKKRCEANKADHRKRFKADPIINPRKEEEVRPGVKKMVLLKPVVAYDKDT